MNENKIIPDYDLLAYLDGEADAIVVAEIEANKMLLQPRLTQLEQQQATLHVQFGQLRPNSLTIGELEMGLLGRAEARDVRNQLQRHPQGMVSAEILQQFWTDLAPVSAETPGLLQQVQRFVAKLVGGDMPSALAMGLRGAQEGIYEAGDYQIVVETDADFDDPSRQLLSGMVMGADLFDTFSATLFRANTPQPLANSDLDEFGNFSFSRLESGVYELIISGQPLPED
ncbi:MAG: hypothetical protein ACPG8W_16490, partial [Candidatus Promineifilaceae bacterium]